MINIRIFLTGLFTLLTALLLAVVPAVTTASQLLDSRYGYFDVSAAEIAEVDWGGNLDALALDVYGQGKTGQSAYDEITDRAIGYDGRMNLAVGVGTVAASTVACVGSAGVGCAIAVGGAVLSEANNMYDGAATIYTGKAQKGAISICWRQAT